MRIAGERFGTHAVQRLQIRGDFMQRFERFAGVGGDAAFDFVPTGGGPVEGSLRG